MLRNRLFNVLVAMAVVIVIVLTAREAAATAGILSNPNSVKGAKTLECLNLPSRYSLRTEYLKEEGMSVPYTEDGPTGVDDGLIELLSNYRTCSR